MSAGNCGEVGVVVPVIDRNRCEGKKDCVVVCPENVFEVRVLAREDRGGLSLLGRMKSFAHGWKQAYTPNASACRACGLCVPACPENAIRLVRV